MITPNHTAQYMGHSDEPERQRYEADLVKRTSGIVEDPEHAARVTAWLKERAAETESIVGDEFVEEEVDLSFLLGKVA